MATGIIKVINVSGITYGFNHKGRTIIIPYDERTYTLPNDVDRSQFGNSIRILEEIINTHEEPVNIMPVNLQKNSSVVEIDLDVEVTEYLRAATPIDVIKTKRVYTKKPKNGESKQSF